jgi:hypothetical protein
MPARQQLQNWSKLGRDTLIELNQYEIYLAEYVAKNRNINSRKKNIFDKKHDKKSSSMDIDILGAMSELAACKLLGIYPKGLFDIGPKSKMKGTDPGDIIYSGYALDVKATKHLNGRLIENSRHSKVDIYCLLVQDTEKSFILKGFYPAVDLLISSNYGHHKVFNYPCYAIDQDNLMSFSECCDRVNSFSVDYGTS